MTSTALKIKFTKGKMTSIELEDDIYKKEDDVHKTEDHIHITEVDNHKMEDNIQFGEVKLKHYH